MVHVIHAEKSLTRVPIISGILDLNQVTTPTKFVELVLNME